MFTEAQMKKALGVKRWAWVQDYSFECGTIDILFKLPLTTMNGTTTYVCEPGYYEMTKKDVIEEIKRDIDTATFTWDQCPYHPNGDAKATLTKETA